MITVKQLREALEGVPDDTPVVVPNVEFGGYDQADDCSYNGKEFRVGESWD